MLMKICLIKMIRMSTKSSVFSLQPVFEKSWVQLKRIQSTISWSWRGQPAKWFLQKICGQSLGGENTETHQSPKVSCFPHKKKEGKRFLLYFHTIQSQGPQGSFLSWDLMVLQSPTSPLGLTGAATVWTSNPVRHMIIRPASPGFPAAVLAPPSWPGPAPGILWSYLVLPAVASRRDIPKS